MNKLFGLLAAVISLVLMGCGGGGGTILQVDFSGNVSGLPTGQSITIVGSLPTTGQSTTINVSSNGAFNSRIDLASGYTFATMGNGNAVISKQPTTGQCTISFIATSNITVVCTSNPSAGGLYIGDLGSLRTTMLVMRDSSSWMWWGTHNATTNVTTYAGVIQNPVGSSTASTYTSNSGWDVVASTPGSYSTSATYVAGSSLTGTIHIGSTDFPMTLTTPSAASYQYSGSPTGQAFAATYSVTLIGVAKADTATFVVGSSGSFTGTTAAGCNFSGSVTPMSTGENAYTLATTFGPSPCTLPNTQTTGVAFLEITTAGTQFLGATVNASKSGGMMYIGTKN